jgi:hypothetical protein
MRFWCLLLVLLLGGVIAPFGVQAAHLRLSDGGVVVDAGTMGSFTFSYPDLTVPGSDKTYKVIEKSQNGSTETLKYDGGASSTLTVSDSGIALHFTNLPADAQRFQMKTIMDFPFSQGGTYKVGDGPDVPFPVDQPTNPNFLQVNGSAILFQNAAGQGLSFDCPRYSFFQLTDNRAWGWKAYQFMFVVAIATGVNDYNVGVNQIASKSGNVASIDKFGQQIAIDFPNKVKTDDDLVQDVIADKAYFASLHPASRDSFGGLPNSGRSLALSKTGYFHVEQHNGRWLMVDPIGNAYFMLGICGTRPGDDYTYIAGRESTYEWLPQQGGPFDSAFLPYQGGTAFSFYVANLIRKYGIPYDSSAYITAEVLKLKDWGFNAGGPFSDPPPAATHFAHVDALPMWQGLTYLPGDTGAFDPFDETNRQALDNNFRQTLPGRSTDPLIIGYYLSNEPLFEDLPSTLTELDGKYACKLRLVNFLAAKYGTIGALDSAWKSDAVSFDSLNDSPIPITTDAAAADVRTFVMIFFDEYYRFIADTFHKYDPNHMLVGNRFQSGTINNESLIRTASKYMDIISFNYYTCGLDQDFLNRIYRWSGKPVMLTEYFFDSPSTTGLPGGALDMKTQRDRGLAYRDYNEHAAATPFIVGTSWFELIDQAATGRWFQKYNGEKANTGFLSVTDRPYKDALAEVVKTNNDIYDVMLGHQKPYDFDDPRFRPHAALHGSIPITRSAGEVAMDGTAAGFPGVPATLIPASRVVIGTDDVGVEGSFKMCWDDNNVYFLAADSDPTPMRNDNPPPSLWAADAIELYFGAEHPDQIGQLLPSDRHILLGAGRGPGKWFVSNNTSKYNIAVVVKPSVSGKGYTLEAKIPFTVLGFTPKPGQTVRFDVAIDDSENGRDRVRQLVWNGSARDSGDRTDWGTARFVK